MTPIQNKPFVGYHLTKDSLEESYRRFIKKMMLKRIQALATGRHGATGPQGWLGIPSQPEFGLRILDLGSWIPGPGSWILVSRILDPGISDPGFQYSGDPVIQ